MLNGYIECPVVGKTMKKVLLTGSTGFIGKNVHAKLGESFDIKAPSRSELNLLDADAVRNYLRQGNFDAVIHLANPTAQNAIDKKDEIFELSLRVFMSLAQCLDYFGKMIYIGSGAEYGKHRNLANVAEDDFGSELPRDGYGLARYVMSEMLWRYDNVTNLRLFACCGPNDPPHKLIPHILGAIRAKEPIKLRQDMYFDYLYAADIAPVLAYFIENTAKHRAYNLCSGKRLKISEIAEEVKRQTLTDLPIVFENNEMGLEYTGSNLRLKKEIKDWNPRPMTESIKEILKHENWQA